MLKYKFGHPHHPKDKAQISYCGSFTLQCGLCVSVSVTRHHPATLLLACTDSGMFPKATVCFLLWRD